MIREKINKIWEKLYCLCKIFSAGMARAMGAVWTGAQKWRKVLIVKYFNKIISTWK